MSLRTLIVDDEPLARERLKFLLSPQKDIEIVGECGDGEEAVTYLKAQPVDLVFLDVQMPMMDGFEVAEKAGLQQLPAIIFITAYQQYAVRAFDIHAIDYLTKPVEPERLLVALERVRQKIASNAALLTQAQFMDILNALRVSTKESKLYLSRLLVRDGAKDVLIAVKKIEWLESADYYCRIHSNGRTYMLRETLSDLSDKLDPTQFIRVHRSAVVNLDYVREIYREGRVDSSIVLANGQRVRVSRTGREKLAEIGRS
ncbi:LytTR family DNA-binding domain-containing protein [Granulicella sp. L60]|uniref:LytR/AlgR family response regulator transcription factor n=1 Tax=Granulicella sp. L60 TaxID=1641866 RepID=UPI00131BE93A|nr:LytTR family DNA-binding domain-containing protein [Granulicella sp. L60]